MQVPTGVSVGACPIIKIKKKKKLGVFLGLFGEIRPSGARM